MPPPVGIMAESEKDGQNVNFLQVFLAKVLTSLDFYYIIINCATSAVWQKNGTKNRAKSRCFQGFSPLCQSGYYDFLGRREWFKNDDT